jgi:hypothetical protein
VRALPAVEEQGQGTLGASGDRVEEARLRLSIPRIGGKVSIYRERWNKRPTVRLDPRACRIPSSRPSGNRAHAIPSCSLKGRTGWRFDRPSGPQTVTGKRDTELKMLLQPIKA